MLAIESLAAIFVADLPKYEKVVLAVLLGSSYGPERKARIRVDHLEIAETLGIDPRIVRRAVKGLTSKRIIKHLEGHYFAYVKDWEKWVHDGSEESADDPLNRMIGPGERKFIALMMEQFGISNASKDKRKVGTKQSPRYPTSGTIQSPARPTSGTGWSPMSADASSAVPGENKDLGISSSSGPVSLDSSPSYEGEIKNTGGDKPPQNLRARGGAIHSELDDLRDQVAKLTEDDNLADVFRDQVGDWFTSGMTTADVREAILIARSKSVRPANFVPFVASTAKRVRNDRLTAERQAREAPSLPFSGPSPAIKPTKAQRDAAEFERQREAFRQHRARKEAADANG